MTRTEKPESTNAGTKWQDIYKSMKVLKPAQLRLLENGPKSLSQSWILGAMYVDYKRLAGIKEPEPPDCQSSFQEWNQSVDKASK